MSSAGRRRLNDTAALTQRRIDGGETANPDVSGFRAARGVRPGHYDTTVNERSEVVVAAKPQPSAGSECLRGATAYLSGKPRR